MARSDAELMAACVLKAPVHDVAMISKGPARATDDSQVGVSSTRSKTPCRSASRQWASRLGRSTTCLERRAPVSLVPPVLRCTRTNRRASTTTSVCLSSVDTILMGKASKQNDLSMYSDDIAYATGGWWCAATLASTRLMKRMAWRRKTTGARPMRRRTAALGKSLLLDALPNSPAGGRWRDSCATLMSPGALHASAGATMRRASALARASRRDPLLRAWRSTSSRCSAAARAAGRSSTCAARSRRQRLRAGRILRWATVVAAACAAARGTGAPGDSRRSSARWRSSCWRALGCSSLGRRTRRTRSAGCTTGRRREQQQQPPPSPHPQSTSPAAHALRPPSPPCAPSPPPSLRWPPHTSPTTHRPGRRCSPSLHSQPPNLLLSAPPLPPRTRTHRRGLPLPRCSPSPRPPRTASPRPSRRLTGRCSTMPQRPPSSPSPPLSPVCWMQRSPRHRPQPRRTEPSPPLLPSLQVLPEEATPQGETALSAEAAAPSDAAAAEAATTAATGSTRGSRGKRRGGNRRRGERDRGR